MYLLPTIPYLRMRFRLAAQEPTRLPAFKGSLIRGAFGFALRRTVCVMSPKQLCSDCMLNRQCVNTKIFETLIFEDPPRFLNGLTTAPKPFVLYCPDEQRDYEAGGMLLFEMCLLGKAIEQHPFIIFAIQRMAERGLGSRRHKFHLESVHSSLVHAAGENDTEWQLLYDGTTQKLTAPATPLKTPTGAPQQSPETLIMRFVTPTRLVVERDLSMDFNFRQLVFRMLRRTLELAHFYTPEATIEWEFHDLLVAASDIRITERNLQWKEQHRYSFRQKQDMFFGGFIGDITLEGELGPFINLLRAAEVLNIGKATTFGLGKTNINLISDNR